MIVQNARKKAGVADELAALRSRYAEWAERVRVAALGGEKNVLVIAEIQELLAGLNKEVKQVISEKDLRTDYDINLNIAGSYYTADFSGGNIFSGYPERSSYVYKVTPASYTLHGNHTLAVEWSELEAEGKRITKGWDEVSANIWAILESVTTDNRLYAVWPEAVELMPKDYQKPQTKALTISVDKINSAIGLQK